MPLYVLEQEKMKRQKKNVLLLLWLLCCFFVGTVGKRVRKEWVCDTSMRHVPHEWVISRWVMSHINKSYFTHVWVVSRMNKSYRTWMSHVAPEGVMSQVYESCHIWPRSSASISCIRGKSSTITKCIYFCELSCHFVLRWDEWGMWWMHMSFHTWMNHVTGECVMSHVSESCHRWMNNATGEGDMKLHMFWMSRVTCECVMSFEWVTSHINDGK